MEFILIIQMDILRNWDFITTLLAQKAEGLAGIEEIERFFLINPPMFNKTEMLPCFPLNFFL